MKRLCSNSRGQFSIIAALFIAAILITGVMATFSTIRYASNQNEPQILSAIDETNLALKQVLGFTVGYYGSVLQVTGNSSYAYELSSRYLKSGLANIADIRPEWGSTFTVTSLKLNTCWFTNESYSKGVLNVTYDLTGLGISGIAYSARSMLNANIFKSAVGNQVCLNVIKDENEPLSDLSRKNFKFYLYRYDNLTWTMREIDSGPTSFANGTYLIDVPSGVNSQSYTLQVEDSRGIIVVASSFSHYKGTLTFNNTFVQDGDYVDDFNVAVDGLQDVGTHSNFGEQKLGPDNLLDTLTSQRASSSLQNYYPSGYSLLGSTSFVTGSLSNLTAEDLVSLKFRSYASAYSAYSAVTYDYANSVVVSSASSMQWQHTTGSGNDRLLLVTIDIFRSNGQPRTVSSITYNGIALTQATTKEHSSNPRLRSYLFYLTNPASGTKTISVTFSGSTDAIGGSVSYTNVNQTSPLQVSSANSGSGITQSTSLTASGSYNKILFGHMGSYNSAQGHTVSEGGGQTNRWAQTGSNYKGRSSEKTVTSGSVSMSWTTSITTSWTAIAAVIEPTRVPTEQTCEVEFSGSSNTDNWDSLLYTIDSLSSVSNTNMTIQLYNYQTGQYPTSGSGYNNALIGTTTTFTQQNITVNPTVFRDILGLWKIKFKAVKTTSSSFDVSIDFARYQTSTSIYALSLEEKWTNINMTYLNSRPALCIYTGTLGASLAVDVWQGGTWRTLSDSLTSGWNNISISSFLTSPDFTIRFRAANNNVQKNWQIDAALLRPESDQELFTSLQNSAATVAVELLQNGTMRWLGQNLQLTTQTVPIPPVPVKAIRVNEKVNGVTQEVPFQIEDWSSEYTVPLGLTNNSTIFGNQQMIVFLVNTHVAEFTVWWNGSDEVVQTPLAYTNTYFSADNPSGGVLSNGKLRLNFGGSFTVTSTVVATGTSSTSTFMQINNQASTYGAGLAYVVHHGVVRDIVQQEAEWSNGVPNCPNLYANIVLTLPANASYFTYQLSLMFLNSQQARTITDLCPIKLSCTIGNLQTENGTILGDPIVATGTQTLNSSGIWGHHWSQFTDGTKGAGIMFTNSSNQLLYAFDSVAPAALRGALQANATAQTIQLLPVTLNPVSFNTALNIAWIGAVATFDGTPQIYSGQNQAGLWVLAEIPPTITVATIN